LEKKTQQHIYNITTTAAAAAAAAQNNINSTKCTAYLLVLVDSGAGDGVTEERRTSLAHDTAEHGAVL